MKLSRRGFLGLLSTGVVGTCVVAKLPTSWIPAPIRRYAALEFMRQQFNAWMQQQATNRDELPDEIVLGTDLYDAFEAECRCNRRILYRERIGPADFDTVTELMFKGVPVRDEPGFGAETRWRMVIRGQFGKEIEANFRPVFSMAA